MSVNSEELGGISPGSTDDVESPRKRARLDNSTRKSWSLIDRRTNYDVLQEMGVGLLEPDDGDTCDADSTGMYNHKPTAKRKRDIENINPTVPSPRIKCGPRSPKTKASPGPSKGKSPRCLEKVTPLQSTDQNVYDTSLMDQYQVDKETPLAQCVSAGYMPLNTGFESCKKSHLQSPIEEDLYLGRRVKPDAMGVDPFGILSDEMMLCIFKWLPKRTLAHCMLVCKRWYSVASDETLWQRLDLGNKSLSKDALGRILNRKPLVVRLASSEITEWKPSVLPPMSRIQYLDLSMSTIDIETLDNLLSRCQLLRKLSLENVKVADSTCEIIGQCTQLDTLNLTMAQGVTANGLTYLLTGCTNLQALNISWCSLDSSALEVVSTMLPEMLLKFNIAGVRIMTDNVVSKICSRCPSLLELDISDCSHIGRDAIKALRSLTQLEHLAISRCYQLSAHSITEVSNIRTLKHLEVWGMMSSNSLTALKAFLPTIHVNHFMFSAIARPTVGTRRTSIWGIRTRD